MRTRNTLLAAAIAVAATTPAFAGGYSDPVVEPTISPEMVAVEATKQSSSISAEALIILMTAIVFGAAATH